MSITKCAPTYNSKAQVQMACPAVRNNLTQAGRKTSVSRAGGASAPPKVLICQKIVQTLLTNYTPHTNDKSVCKSVFDG